MISNGSEKLVFWFYSASNTITATMVLNKTDNKHGFQLYFSKELDLISLERK